MTERLTHVQTSEDSEKSNLKLHFTPNLKNRDNASEVEIIVNSSRAITECMQPWQLIYSESYWQTNETGEYGITKIMWFDARLFSSYKVIMQEITLAIVRTPLTFTENLSCAAQTA